MEEEEEAEEEEQSQLQLLRASEGARELARMIGSLSRAPHLDGRSKHVAKDLLRGARDLQSSLLMLAKLQEASKRRKEVGIGRTARLRRFASMSKPRRRPEFAEGMKGWRRYGLEGHTHSAVETTVHPKRFGSWNSNFSTDESSRCCLEEEISGVGDDDDDDTTSKSGAGELRRMSSPFELRGISEYVEEEIGVQERMPSKEISADSIRELRRVIADSLSRQNLLPRPSDDELESPTPPAGPAAAALQPNVVAKLMGLEEAPPAREAAERKRPAFDIDDRPNARKAQMPEGPNPTEKTLHEIVAAMQFSGLLRGGRGDASQFEKLGRSFREEEEEDAPPIVIMKPLFMPRWEEARKSNGEKAPKSIKRTDDSQKLLLAAKKEEEEEEGGKENIKKKKIMISQANTTGSTAPYKTEKKNSTSFAKENKNSTAKSVRKSTNNKSDGLKHCEDGKRNNPHEGIDSSSKTRTLIARNQDDRQETLWEATQKTNQPVKTAAARIASELEEDLTCLLLSSRSFLNHAKELFHVDARQPPAPPCYKRRGIGEDVMRNAKLYLDCGKELMVRTSREQEAFGNPMLRAPTRTSTLGRLAEEVSRAVEALTRCSESEGGGDLYRRLERDLAATASANWDVGWAISTCTGEDASLVIDELGELVMSRLVAEVAQDLVWL